MQSTYKDIIDEKITEWQSGLKKLEDYSGKASADKAKIRAKVEDLKSAVDAAIVQLHDLDKQETVDNTVETKNRMLKIFSSIDKDFTGFEDKTPFML